MAKTGRKRGGAKTKKAAPRRSKHRVVVPALPLHVFFESSADPAPALAAAYESGLADAGWPAGAGGKAIVTYKSAGGSYDNGNGNPGEKQTLYQDLTAANDPTKYQLIIAAGGLVCARAAQKVVTKVPFVILIGQAPRFALDSDMYCGGINLDMPNEDVARHDFLVGHYGIARNKVCLIWNKNSHMGIQERRVWKGNNWPDVPVTTNDDAHIKSAFTAAKQNADAVVVSGDPYFTSRMNTVVAAGNDGTTKQLTVCYPFVVYMQATPTPLAKSSMIFGADLEFAYRQLGRKSGAVLDAVAAGLDGPDTGLDIGTTTAPIYIGG
jgi:hypothetical protein